MSNRIDFTAFIAVANDQALVLKCDCAKLEEYVKFVGDTELADQLGLFERKVTQFAKLRKYPNGVYRVDAYFVTYSDSDSGEQTHEFETIVITARELTKDMY